MGEVLFGLIMTLSFTLAAGIVIQEEGRAGARAMLVGILGCNLAWGVIDGVLYVLGQAFERGRVQRIGSNLRQATSEVEARQMVAARVRPTPLVPVTDEAGAAVSLYQSIVEHDGPRRTCHAEPGATRGPDGRPGGGLARVRLQLPRRAAVPASSTTRAWRCGCPTQSCSGLLVQRRLARGAAHAGADPGSRASRSCSSESCWSRWRFHSAVDQRGCSPDRLGVKACRCTRRRNSPGSRPSSAEMRWRNWRRSKSASAGGSDRGRARTCGRRAVSRP